ncbi:hypothetical protein BHE74_00050588 [Ensete ventricosum]|nr:hypothetical protein BHE74_00050588 [Ensete ventricosum]
MDCPLGYHTAHELESIMVHGDQIQPAADPPPPTTATPRSSSRGLLPQPSKIKLGFRDSTRITGGGERKNPGKMTRMVSSAQMGIKGLRFLDKTSGGKEGWNAVEKRFGQFAVGGRLPKEHFARCIAETLKFNMALILIPVCRNTLTRLRSTHVSPFEWYHLSVHIRTLGDWTSELRNLFGKVS